MGLLGMVFLQNTGSVVVRSSPFVSLFKTTGSVVVRSSQGRFFFFTCPGPENVIFGHFGIRFFEKCQCLFKNCHISQIWYIGLDLDQSYSLTYGRLLVFL